MKQIIRDVLSHEQIADIKIQLRDMLKYSKLEYAQKDRVHFQQACEKLYKVMIHIIEVKSGYNIRAHEQLQDTFYWQQAKFHISTMADFFRKMNTLHYYFYEGGIYPSPIVDNSYLSLLKFIESIVDRL